MLQFLQPLVQNLSRAAEVEMLNAPRIEDLVVLRRGRLGRREWGKGEVFACQGEQGGVDFRQKVRGEGEREEGRGAVRREQGLKELLQVGFASGGFC